MPSANIEGSTRINRATGGLSSPDVIERIQWHVGIEIGGSDHLPCIMSVKASAETMKLQNHTVLQGGMTNGPIERFQRRSRKRNLASALKGSVHEMNEG